jgi:hypothetical protein
MISLKGSIFSLSSRPREWRRRSVRQFAKNSYGDGPPPVDENVVNVFIPHKKGKR